METAARVTQRTPATAASPGRTTRALLACGAASAPFFYALATGQALTRSGFDIRRHAISLLSLGDLGWVQVLNFAMTGLLVVAGAVGMRRALRGGRGGTWAPLLVGIYGVGLLMGAAFRPDPGLGFPAGAPAGMPATMSAHAAIHMLGFMVAFLAVIAACFVLRRRFAESGQVAWARLSLATGVVTPVLVVLGSSLKDWVGVIFAVAGLVAFGWVSAVAAMLRSEISER